MKTKHYNMIKRFFIFSAIYIGFGVYSPVKMSMINTTLMSYISVAMFEVSNTYIAAALFLRSLV